MGGGIGSRDEGAAGSCCASPWGEAHLIPANAFTYMPAAAWLYAPAAHMPLGASFLVYAFAMLIVFVLAAVVAARVYGLGTSFTVPAILGWAPATAAFLTGQNSPLVMLLALLVVLGYTRDRWIVCGFATDLLLYKPTYAVRAPTFPYGRTYRTRENQRSVGRPGASTPPMLKTRLPRGSKAR